MRLHFQPDAQVPAAVRECELSVLNHWYGDTPELLDEAYGPYEQHQTTFMWLTVQDDQVVGFLRLIRPGALPLKTMKDIAGPPWNLDAEAAVREAGIDVSRTWDIATLGVRHKVLGAAATSVAAQILYHAAGEAALANGAPWVIAIGDRRVRVLAKLSGMDMALIPGAVPAEYMGSPACVPVFTHVETLFAEQREQDPEKFRWGALGKGAEDLFDEIVLPRREDLVIPPAMVDLTGTEASATPEPGSAG